MDGPRPAQPAEIPAVVSLVDRVFRESAGKQPTMGAEFPLLFSPQNAPNLWIMTDSGQIVSHIAVYPTRLVSGAVSIRAISIGAVCTDPAWRGRGLASLLLDHVVRTYAERGYSLMLISGDRGLYLRKGAQFLGRTLHLRIPAGPLPPGYRLVPARLGDLIPLYRLLQAEPIRYDRTPMELAGQIQGLVFAVGKGQILWVERSGQRVAFLAVGGHSPPPSVFDLAGDREALAHAAPGVAAHVGETVRWVVPAWDGPLVQALTPRAESTESHPYLGTFLPLSVPSLLRDTWPALAQVPGLRVEPVPGGARLHLPGGTTVGPEPGALCRLLFGAPPGQEEVGLGSLPIPLPGPHGLGYV